jgi:hypothetical protein
MQGPRGPPDAVTHPNRGAEMPKRGPILSVLAAVFVTACGGEPQVEQGTDASTGRVASANPSPACRLFTRQEISSLLALPVGDGEVAGPLGTSCQWDATSDDASYVQVQIIPGHDYWTNPTRASGYEAVSGIGSEAYVHPELGGWTAGALTDTAVAAVSLAGGAASGETAVRLLRMLVERM